MLASVVLLACLLFAVVYTEVGTRAALGLAVDWYDGAIPGRVKVARIEGSLGSRVTLLGVELQAADDRDLVTVRELSLQVAEGSLFRGHLEVVSLSAEGVHVELPAEGPGYASLAPPAEPDEEPSPPSELLGPDLPLRISAVVGLRDVEVRAEGAALLRLEHLDLRADAEGSSATASLEAAFELPVADDLAVHSLSLDVGWADPVVTVGALTVATDRGDAELIAARFDAEHLSGEVESVVAEFEPGAWATLTGMPTSLAPRLAMSASGSPEEFAVDGDIVADDENRVALSVRGSAEPDFDIEVDVTGDAVLSRWLPGAPDLSPHAVLELGLRGTVTEGLHASASLSCSGCPDVVHPIELDARLDAWPAGPEPEPRSGSEPTDVLPAWLARADLQLRYRDTRVEVDGWAAPGDVAGVALRVPAADLAQLHAAAADLVELPPLRGRVRLDAACSVVLSGPLTLCGLGASVAEGEPVRDARLAVSSVTRGEEEAFVRLHALRGAAKQGRVRLLGSSADVSLSPHDIEVRGLDLRVANDAGQGRINVQGHLREHGESSLGLGIQSLDLRAVAALVPGLNLRGHLDGRVDVAGTREAPRPNVSLHLRGLGVSGMQVGDVTLDASFADRRLAANASVARGDFGDWAVEARGRADLSLDPVVARLGTREAISVEVVGRGIEVERVLGALGSPTDIAGRVGLKLVLAGTPRRPRVDLTLDAEQTFVEDDAVGDVHLEAGYDDGRATAGITVDHPAARRIHVEAEVPVVATLLGPPRWRSQGEHRARVEVSGLRLAALEPWTGVALSGRTDLDVTAVGTPDDPSADLLLEWRNVALGRRRMTSGALEVALRGREVDAAAAASGPGFAGLGLTAQVPLIIDAKAGRVGVDPDAPLHIVASLDGVVLQEVARWLPEPVDLRGHVDTLVEVSGTLADPDATATMEATRLGYGPYAIGEVEVDASLAAGDARAVVKWQEDWRRKVEVTARAGLLLDLPRGKVAVDETKPYVIGVEVPHLDRKLLQPFVEVPPELEFATSLHAIARGPTEALTVAASVRGHARGLDGAPVPILVELDADPMHQSLLASIGKSFTAAVDTQAALVELQAGRQQAADIPVVARFDVEGAPLRLFGNLVPTVLYDTRGTLDLHASVGGSVGTPQLDGRAEIEGGAVTVVPLRQRLEGVVVGIDFANERVVLEKLSMRSGRGSLSGSGHVNLTAEGLDGAVRLKADRLPASSPGLPRLEITSDVDVALASDSAATRVDVKLASSRIDVVSSNVETAKQIPSSPRVQLVQRLDPLGTALGAEDVAASPQDETVETDAEEEVEEDAPPFDLSIALVDPLRIRGPAVDMAWGGRIEARQEGGTLTTRGDLEVERGFFELLTNRFEIQSGRITIPDDEVLQLFVDLEAEARTGEFDVVAALRGPLPRPELQLRSSPALNESQIFTLLLTGTADFDQADPEQMEAQAAALLAAVSNPALQRQLNERLGVDRIGVGVGESTDQPILSVGKNLTRKVYAETKYHQNAPRNQNRAELRVRYSITPRWSLETFFGDAAEAGFDVFWGKAFDRRRAKKRSDGNPPTAVSSGGDR